VTLGPASLLVFAELLCVLSVGVYTALWYLGRHTDKHCGQSQSVQSNYSVYLRLRLSLVVRPSRPHHTVSVCLYHDRCVSLIHSGSNGSVAYLYKPTKATGHSFRDLFCFYRAMHYSAKRGLAIACRLSVRLSVTLVDCDHIGWNSSKIISRLVSVRRL